MAVTALGFASCDNVDEADRYIYVKPAEAKRAVLIEDFTGQRCTNCPNATIEINKLQEQYGENIIPVAIHSGPFAHVLTMSTARKSLCTETGDQFFLRWFTTTQSQPVVKVNRGEKVEQIEMYASVVAGEIEKETPLTLSLENTYDESAGTLDIAVSAITARQVSGKLEVWITEDNIVDEQSMPDLSKNMEYVHNHVFRAAVTSDIFGDDITVAEGETKAVTYTLKLDDKWKPADLSVVAFVSNDTDGVLQATKSPVVDNTAEPE